jgi:ATP-dependent Clp protease protease subunit
MSDFDIIPLDLDDLAISLGKNIKEDMKNFEDLINLDGAIKREIYINGIDDGTGQSVEGYIRFWNSYDDTRMIPIEDREPIKLYIDSCGGSLTDTLTIIDAIKMSKTPVITIAIGCAYSGGFFIFISGDKRIAYPHASFLFHEGSTQNGGTSGQFENYTQFYKRQLGQLKKIVLEHTNITDEEYDNIRKDDIWFDAEDGVNKGFVDEIAKEFVS